jgi:hypothetical protein
MTRGARRSIRAVAVAVICANAAILYAAKPARAATAMSCPVTLIDCPLSGTCFLSKQDQIATCNAACMNAGGSTCHATPLAPVCQMLGCDSRHDELICHCST